MGAFAPIHFMNTYIGEYVMSVKTLNALVKANYPGSIEITRNTPTLNVDIEIIPIITEPPVLVEGYSAAYWSAAEGGNVVTRRNSTVPVYLRFKLTSIPAGTVIKLRCDPTLQNATSATLDLKSIQTNGATDNTNGGTLRVMTAHSNTNITHNPLVLTFDEQVIDPLEFVIQASFYHPIYRADKYSTSSRIEVLVNDTMIILQLISLTP